MKSTAAWEDETFDNAVATPPDAEEPNAPEGNITSLRELTFKLLRKVESIGEAQARILRTAWTFTTKSVASKLTSSSGHSFRLEDINDEQPDS